MSKAKALHPRPASRPLWRNRITAAGWLTLAGVILAWPRRESFSHRFWRGFGNTMRRLRGVPLDAAPAADRGLGADSPAEIPLIGWRDIALRTWSEFNDDRIVQVSGGVAFFALLALFPGLAAFVSLYGLFGDVGAAEKQLSLFTGVLPGDTLKFTAHEMARFAQKSTGQLSFAFAISLLISLWSANGAMKALFDGLNVAYEQKEKRGLIRLNLYSLTFTAGGLVFVIAALSAVVATPSVLAFLRLNYDLGWLEILRWPAMLLGSILALSVLYRYGPSRHRVRWRWITWGGAVAALLWLSASMGFSWYVGAFAHYDRTYGSLGAVVVFMTWIWLSTIIILAGAELNAEIEAQMGGDASIEARPR